MARALLASVRDRVSLVRALLDTSAITMVRLEEELALTAPDAPFQRHPVPILDLCARLPPHLCAALVAIPVRADTRTGTVDVALADASDGHAAEEIAYYLKAPVRVVRSPLGAIESAIAQVRHESGPPAVTSSISVPPPSPVRPVARTPPWGMPALGTSPEVHIAGIENGFNGDETPSAVSERPLPLIPKSPSENAPDIPIPLSRPITRRLTPGAGLVALARAAQELDDEEDPVVELRRPRATPTSTQAPAPVVPPAPARPSPEEQRTITQASAASLNQLLREMTKVTERDPLMELVLIAVRPTAPKAALFAVKKESFVGWICTSDFGERSALCLVQLDSRKPSILSSTATVGSYFGSVPRNEVHAPLSKVIKSSDPEVLGVAIKAAGRPVALLIAHDVAEPVRAMTVLTEVARVAGDTLEKILRARR